MRINLGCGRVYKKGYINIDAYDDTVADEVQEATDLRYPDDSVERIEACQVIEHLGFAKSIYALSEWFRVLKPGGSLLIETPDLEATFRLFLKASEKDKSDLLIWIYGLDAPGLKHTFCFPSRLIRDLTRKIGFESIEQQSFTLERNRPVLRVTCTKPDRYWHLQFIASFRKRLNKGGIIDISNENEALNLESSIDFLASKLAECKTLEDITETQATEIAVELGVYSPRVAACLMRLTRRFPELLDVLTQLDRTGLLRRLVHVFKTMPVDPGKQKETFRLVRDMGREAVSKAILSKGGSMPNSSSSVSTQSGETDGGEKVESFSEEVLKRLSDILFCQGGKEFSVGNHKKALQKFRESILLFRDNIMSYINVARLMRISGNNEEAENNYDKALRLLRIFNYGRNASLSKAIEKERQNREATTEPLLALGAMIR